MCHESPTSQFLAAMVTTLGLVFVFYHIWAYDRGKCLLFTRRSAFRWAIVWMFLLSMFFFEAWNVILVYVKYKEWYEAIPVSATETKIVPVPYTHWDPHRQHLVRIAYQLMAIAWMLVLAIHSEETLYWAYLIGAIRWKATKSWFQSIQFKIWLVLGLCSCAMMPAIANIQTENILEMEDNIFLAGSVSALVLFTGSIWLLIVFPGFIKESQRQGANPDVVDRLKYFKELNVVRTIFRFLYCVSIFAVAVDGRTTHKRINSSPFWLDLFYICGLFFVFSSNLFSLMILLPRNTAAENGSQDNMVFVRRRVPAHSNMLPSTSTIESTAKNYAPYALSPSDLEAGAMHVQPAAGAGAGMGRRGSSGWAVLGERLNMGFGSKNMADDQIQLSERGALAARGARVGEAREVREVREVRDVSDAGEVGESSRASRMTGDSDKPFAPTKGERILREGERENFTEPQLLNLFRSPADFTEPPAPRGLEIVVVTDTLVEKE